VTNKSTSQATSVEKVSALTRNARDEFERSQNTERSQRFDVEHRTVGKQWKKNANRPARCNTPTAKMAHCVIIVIAKT